jgi:hypothetical protein
MYLNAALDDELGLGVSGLTAEEAAALFSGNDLPEGAEPIAQAYAGHQFGGFSPQLGDGRALLLGEVIDRRGQRHGMGVRPQSKILRCDASLGGDGRSLRHHQTRTTRRERAQVHQMPVIGQTVNAGVLTHRAYPDSIAEGLGAQGEGGKEC